MKKTIGQYEFTESFKNAGRGEQFSYEGLKALFEYLEELEESCGEEIELDVISLCCDYCEHKSAVDCIKDHGYGFEFEEGQDDEEKEEAALEWLKDNTQVIEFDGGVIIQQF